MKYCAISQYCGNLVRCCRIGPPNLSPKSVWQVRYWTPETASRTSSKLAEREQNKLEDCWTKRNGKRSEKNHDSSEKTLWFMSNVNTESRPMEKESAAMPAGTEDSRPSVICTAGRVAVAIVFGWVECSHWQICSRSKVGDWVQWLWFFWPTALAYSNTTHATQLIH